MRVLPCAAVALAGCAQLFGIDNTTGPKPGASLQLERISIGAGVVNGPLDVTSETATFYVPDKANPTALDPTPGVQTAMDTWSAPKLLGTPIVQFSLPDLPMPMQHLWELPSAHVTGAFVAYEHPNPQPAPMASQIGLAVNLPSPYQAGEAFDIQAIGAWTHHVLTAAELPAAAGATSVAATIPYSTFSPMTQSPAYRISANDVVVVLRYLGAQLTGVYQNQPGFDQSDTMDMITGSMVAVTADRTLAATIDQTAIGSRFVATRPAVSNLTGAWSISAATGAKAGSALGPQLDAGGIAMADTMVMASYGNPFESLGWNSVATVVMEETRTYMFNTAVIGLGASLIQVGDPATLTTVDLAAPLPQQVNVDDNQLVTDGATVTIDLTVPHTITMLAENKPASLYTLILTDLSLDMNGAVVRTPVLEASSTTPSFKLPPGILQAGHTYIPTVRAFAGGFPNAASGDLATRAMPYAVATFDGGVFTVVSQ